MQTNTFKKHDVTSTVDAASATRPADAAYAANAAGGAGVADVAGGADRGDCIQSPSVRSGVSTVSIGGGPSGLAEFQPLRSEADRAASFSPVRWSRNAVCGEAVSTPRVSSQVRHRGHDRDVDEPGVKGRASGGESGSDDGESESTGIGRRFAEPKPIAVPPKLYRIGEVVEYSGLSRQTIHNYTTMGLLIEVRRTDGGHRLYDESVFERLNGVIALKAQHKSLAHIREYYAKLDTG